MIYYILNIVLFIILGTTEAFLWHKSVGKITKKQAKNLHIPLVLIRCVWFLFVWYKLDVASTVALIMCYPFWHLGTMYQVRHWLNKAIYKEGFLDSASNTSTSILDTLFPIYFEIRLASFVFGTYAYYAWITT